MQSFYGNVRELGDRSESPGKSFLFFFTATHLESGLAWAKVVMDGRARQFFVGSGALSTGLENPRDSSLLHLVVLITAAGLQGEQPLVDRIM